MPPNVHGYEASIEAAKRALEAAQNALSRDVGQAIVNAQFAFLRDKCDVQAFVDLVSELAEQPGFVAKVHAVADQARSEQPLRGRPPKASSTASESKNASPAPIAGLNADAN